MFALAAVLAAACQSAPLPEVRASFVTSPMLAVRKPADIAVLRIEDGTPTRSAERHLDAMRELLVQRLPDRRYSPLAATAVDASLRGMSPAAGETVQSPAFLRRIAGKATEDAVLVVRVEQWSEDRLMIDRTCQFRLQAAMVATDGEVLWNGWMQGAVKAGGMGAAPLGKDAMARSCVDLVIQELVSQLTPRSP